MGNWFVFLLPIAIPTAAMDRKNILKTKCCFQLRDFITPPQVHGKCTFENNMSAIYAVKNNNKKNELYNPAFRVAVIVSSAAVSNSAAGNNQLITGAALFMNGAFSNCDLNKRYSKSLLHAVYTKSTMSKELIISMVILCFI